ncbi:hypothetical protein AB0B50_15655 [Streptomyces sp. NPDC041068]|uniref:hypothetical protein n=1 Tax=Streptomyces sp. NPDC041068 TaxID=3155130 RepID=UPI0033FEB475
MAERTTTPAHTTALFPATERDKLTLRLQNAVNGFVDGPRDAVEDADRILEETITGLTRTLTERRRTLRTSWESLPSEGRPEGTSEGIPGSGAPTPEGTPAKTPTADTEQLRLALRDYRETAEHLLRM